MKTLLSSYKYKFMAVYRLLKPSTEHWFFVNIPEKELMKSFQRKAYEPLIIMGGLQEYNIKRIIKDLSNDIDDIDLMLGKAHFEAKAYELAKQKQR